MFLGGVVDEKILTEKSSVVFCSGLENCKNIMAGVHREQTLNHFIKWGLKKVSKIKVQDVTTELFGQKGKPDRHEISRPLRQVCHFKILHGEWSH